MSTGGVNSGISTSGSSKVMNIFAGDYAACDEGSFYTANLAATASTAVATTTVALGTSSPTLVVYNQNPIGGYSIYMRSVKLRVTTATTGVTNVNHVGVLNPSPSTFTTIGTALSTPVSTNSNSGTTSRAAIYGGVNVMTTQASVPGSRLAHTGPVSSIIPIVLDQWMLSYGDPVMGNNFGTVITTTTSFISLALPPIIIAPQWIYTLGFYGTSWAAAAPSYSIDVSYIERPAGQ